MAPQTHSLARPGPSVSAGLPEWITADLIADTIETWQPYYRKALTRAEAIDILLNVGRSLDVLTEAKP